MSKKNKNAPEYERDDDGQVYIAITSRGRTRLGRMLAAGAHLPFELRNYGKFNSLAGLIRYLRGDRRDTSHLISGIEHDGELCEKVQEQYEEILFDRALVLFRSVPDLNADLPLFAYREVDGDMQPVKLPEWMLAAWETDLRRRKAIV